MTRLRSAINPLLQPIAALFAAIGWWVFNWPAMVSLHKRWWAIGDTYEIGYPLVAIGIYWAFTQRSRLRADAIEPSLPGCALFLLALLASAAAQLAQLLVLQQLMVPVSLWLGLLAVFGARIALPLLLPCALLICGVPVWDFLVDPLRALTVETSRLLLGLIRIPAMVDGFHIVLTSGVMLVAEACSGLNLLLAALVLSTLQATLGLRSNGRRLLLVAIGVAIGIVDNWIRVFVLIAVAHYSEMRNSLIYDHVGFGWWLFAASLVPFFFIARAMERREQAALRAQPSVHAGAAPAATRPGAAARAIAAGLFVGVAAFGMAAGATYLQRSATSAIAAFAAPPNAVPASDGWLPQYVGYDLAQSWRLASAQRVYDLTVLLYHHQRHGKKLIYYANRIADPALVRTSTKQTLSPGRVVNLTVIGGDKPRVVWWYYRVDAASTASARQAKWLQLRATLKGDSAAALVAVSMQCRDRDCASEVAAAGADLQRGELLEAIDAALGMPAIAR